MIARSSFRGGSTGERGLCVKEENVTTYCTSRSSGSLNIYPVVLTAAFVFFVLYAYPLRMRSARVSMSVGLLR